MRVLHSILIAALGLLPPAIQAQQLQWFPPVMDVRGIPVAVCADENEGLFVAEISALPGFRNGLLILHRYNGLFSAQSKPLQLTGLGTGFNNSMAVCLFQNKVYVAGSFQAVKEGIRGVAVWDGTRWSAADAGLWAQFPVHEEISVNSLVVHNARLYASGVFRESGSRSLRDLAVFDGSTWSPVAFPRGSLAGLCAQGDTLYAGGSFDSLGDRVARNLAYLYRDTWQRADVPAPVKALTSTSRGLAACFKDTVYIRNRQFWSPLANGWDYKILRIDGLHGFRHLLYASGRFIDRSGRLHFVLQWNGQSWQSVLHENETAVGSAYSLQLTTYRAEHWLAGHILSHQQQKAGNLLAAKPGFSVIQGRVFADRNSDCLSNPGENGVPMCILSVNDGQAYYNSDSLGEFRFLLRSDTIQQITLFPPDGYVNSGCAGIPLRFEARTGDTAFTVQYPLELTPMPQGQVSACIQPQSGYKARHGYATAYSLMRCDGRPMKGKVNLFFPAGMRLLRANPAPQSIEPGKLHWEMDGESRIRLELEVSHTAFLPGDSLQFVLEHDGSSPATLQQLVVAAYDPNDKQCKPETFDASTSFLDYHIRFQNLGNDSAVHVFVVDSISRKLPLQFLRVTGHSHPDKYRLNYRLQGHAVIWEFRDVLLPPLSTAGEEGSSGFVRFRAGLATGLQRNDTITNKAHIYFDFQPAVITNTTRTPFADTRSTPSAASRTLQLWPNPAGTAAEVQFSVPPFVMRHYEVFTADGRLWQHGTIPSGAHSWRLPVSNWPAGIYIFRVDYGSGLASGSWVRI